MRKELTVGKIGSGMSFASMLHTIESGLGNNFCAIDSKTDRTIEKIEKKEYENGNK